MPGYPHSDEVRPMKVVAMGGGTGLSTLLHGLKQHVLLSGEQSFDRVLPFISELSAIVTVSDDGGSSGRLRKELNVPPPGDIRNSLVRGASNGFAKTHRTPTTSRASGSKYATHPSTWNRPSARNAPAGPIQLWGRVP